MIQYDFDFSIVNKMDGDQVLTVPLPLMCGLLSADKFKWPCPVVPFSVTAVQYPVPSARSCYNLGTAIRKVSRRIAELT